MDLVNAQIQLKSCQERLQQLEQAVECASDPTRIRLLGGDNPSHKELNEKIDALEVSVVHGSICKIIFCIAEKYSKYLTVLPLPSSIDQTVSV